MFIPCSDKQKQQEEFVKGKLQCIPTYKSACDFMFPLSFYLIYMHGCKSHLHLSDKTNVWKICYPEILNYIDLCTEYDMVHKIFDC